MLDFWPVIDFRKVELRDKGDVGMRMGQTGCNIVSVIPVDFEQTDTIYHHMINRRLFGSTESSLFRHINSKLDDRNLHVFVLIFGHAIIWTMTLTIANVAQEVFRHSPYIREINTCTSLMLCALRQPTICWAICNSRDSRWMQRKQWTMCEFWTRITILHLVLIYTPRATDLLSKMPTFIKTGTNRPGLNAATGWVQFISLSHCSTSTTKHILLIKSGWIMQSGWGFQTRAYFNNSNVMIAIRDRKAQWAIDK